MKLGNDPWQLFFVGCWWKILTVSAKIHHMRGFMDSNVLLS